MLSLSVAFVVVPVLEFWVSRQRTSVGLDLECDQDALANSTHIGNCLIRHVRD